MSILTISRGSYYRGKEVAEKVAQALGYCCISRDVMVEALGQFELPEIKLVRELHDVPSILDRFSFGKERYISAISSALLQQFQQDNIVYHGLAGHFFLSKISHVLKVRIIADLETRIQEEMKREGISARKARYILKNDDDERRKWCLYLYGIDINNPELYDLVLQIGKLSVDDAVEIILNTIRRPCFQPSAESQTQIESLAMATLVQASLFEFPNARVSARDGKASIVLKAPLEQKEQIAANIETILNKIEAVKDYDIHFEPYL